MKNLFQLWVYAPGTHSEDWQHTWDSIFVHMSILQTVAMATNNCKDNHFFLLFYTYLLPFLELASVKYLETRQSRKNNFGQHFNLKKEIVSTRFLKIVQFHIFD